MFKFSPRAATLLAATVAAGASGAAISGAATSDTTGTTGTPSAQRPAGGAGERALTGEAKQKGEVKGRRAGGPGRGGPGGPGGRGMHANLAAVAKTLGVTEAELKRAVEAARPDRSAGKQAKGAERAAALATSLGESTSDVRELLTSVCGTDGPGDHGPGGHGPGGRDDTALVAALVKKFSISESKARTALDAAQKADRAEHSARETAMHAAVAKALGKDVDAVKKAFAANRPKPPAGAPVPPAGAPAPPAAPAP